MIRGVPPAPRVPAARALARGIALPAVAGALCVLGFAPFGAWPVPVAALAALFAVWARSGSPLQAALSGYAFGLAFFLAGVSWVFVSLHFYGAMPAALAALATFLFCAFLALLPALAGWLTVRFAGPAASNRLWLAPAAFTASEWVRGWIFTGFPWIDIGTSQVPGSPLAGYAPWVGAYGTSFAVAGAAALCAAIPASFAMSRTRMAVIASLAALFALGGAARMASWTSPAGPPLTVALLQGNVPQELKWRDEERVATLAEYRAMILDAKAQVVVLPETALPDFWDQLPAAYTAELREHARATGKTLLIGTVERETRNGVREYYNSVARVGGAGFAAYRKRHLVPFGEFIPPGFHWILAVLHIPLSDFARGAPVQPPLEAAGAKFAVAVCYEDMFGEEMIDFLPAAQVLLNVSNLAWFGDSLAPEQHLQASQMRALETGRWMVRATNTGVTAAIDERGRVVSRLANFTRGTLVATVVPREGSTPYSWWGNYAALAMMALVAARAVWVARRRRDSAPKS
ncbi:MAG: apolipoprotein N-acyltransferase [Usitatibacter sp.]